MVIDIVIADSNGKQKGVPVPSPVSGTLVRRTDPGGYGNYVNILDDFGKVLARVAHLDKFVAKSNQRINAGDIIGTQGHTGRTIPRGEAGTHLHIEAPRKILETYIPMLATGKGMSTGVPTYNRLDGSVGRRDGTASRGMTEKEQFALGTVAIANKYSMNPRDLFGVMGAESGFRANAVNMADGRAVGLIQFMPYIAKELGTSRLNY